MPVQSVTGAKSKRTQLRRSKTGAKQHEHAGWESIWQELPSEARLEFAAHVVIPYSSYSVNYETTPTAKFKKSSIAKLVDEGFFQRPASRQDVKALKLSRDCYSFAHRVKSINSIHILQPHSPLGLQPYITSRLQGDTSWRARYSKLMKGAGVYMDSYYPDMQLATYCFPLAKWAECALSVINNPLAEALYEVIADADGLVRLADISAMMPGKKSSDLRRAVDALLSHWAIFEDLLPRTGEIVLGLHPKTRRRRNAPARPKELTPVTDVLEPTSGANLLLEDFRELLLEMAGRSPRLKQDGGLYVNDKRQIEESMVSWPEWLEKLTGLNKSRRVDFAFKLALDMELVSEDWDIEGAATSARLTEAGRKWLALASDRQEIFYIRAFQRFGNQLLTGCKSSSSPLNYNDDVDEWDDWDESDWNDEDAGPDHHGIADYFGVDIYSVPATKSKSDRSRYKGKSPKPDFKKLQQAMFKAWCEVPTGQFVKISDFADFTSAPRRNPLLMGRNPEAVELYARGRALPGEEELADRLCQELLLSFNQLQLVPLGCVRIGLDADSNILISRQPSLHRYFGKKSDEAEAVTTSETRVIVQPDFSIVIMGTQAAAVAADLIMFCERDGKKSGPGSMVLKLTKESVLRAVTGGLSIDELLQRLNKQLTGELPKNVARQLKEWGDWTKKVEVDAMTVIRCPDVSAAARVLSVLKGDTERLTDTIIGYKGSRITPAQMKKFQEQGIIVPAGAAIAAPSKSTKNKAKKRRYKY